MARTKGNGSENKLSRADLPPEGETARAADGAMLGEMPAGDMNAPAPERTMIAARPGIDTPVPRPMPGVTDDTTMPAAGEMDDGAPGVLGDMPGERSGVTAEAAETTEAALAAPTAIEVTGEWRLTFTIGGITRA